MLDALPCDGIPSVHKPNDNAVVKCHYDHVPDAELGKEPERVLADAVIQDEAMVIH